MTSSSLHILLVEDNLDLRDDFQFQLAACGFVVAAVGDAPALDRHLRNAPCDIAILDIGLPGENGLSIASRLRQAHPQMGIIMLTAYGELDMRLNGFERGADIYLVKPVDWRELAAQIRALQRRLPAVPPANASTWILKQAGRELVTPNRQSIALTHLEGQVLGLLAEHPGQTVARATLIAEIAGQQAHAFDPRRLEVCICRLRQKMLDADPSAPRRSADALPLKTARGVGYAFTQTIVVEGFPEKKVAGVAAP